MLLAVLAKFRSFSFVQISEITIVIIDSLFTSMWLIKWKDELMQWTLFYSITWIIHRLTLLIDTSEKKLWAWIARMCFHFSPMFFFCWNILCCWFTYVGFLRVLIKFSCGILNSKQTFCCIIQHIARSYIFFWSSTSAPKNLFFCHFYSKMKRHEYLFDKLARLKTYVLHLFQVSIFFCCNQVLDHIKYVKAVNLEGPFGVYCNLVKVC